GAAATGRIDGVAVVAGMFAGTLGTGLAFAPLRAFYDSTARGALTLPQLLHVPYGFVVAAVVAIALGLWSAATKLPLSRAKSGDSIAALRKFLLIAAIVAGALASFAGNPNHTAPQLDVQRLAAAVE